MPRARFLISTGSRQSANARLGYGRKSQYAHAAVDRHNTFGHGGHADAIGPDPTEERIRARVSKFGPADGDEHAAMGHEVFRSSHFEAPFD